MKKFFRGLITGKGEESSKRFAALITLFVLLILTIMATLKDEKWVTPEFMFNALCMVVGGGLGLTVLEKIFHKEETPPPPPPVEPQPENEEQTD